MMKKNIVILTVGVGNGHTTAAFGIKKALENSVQSRNIRSIQIIDIAEAYFFGKIVKYIFDNSSFWFLKKLYIHTNTLRFSWFDKFFINSCLYSLNKKLKKISHIEIYITFPMLQLLDICFEKNIKTIIQVTDFYTPHFSWAWNSENLSEIRVLDVHAKQYLEANIKNLSHIEEKICVSEFPLPLKKNKDIHIIPKKSKMILCFFHNVLFGNEEEILEKIQNHSVYKQYKICILSGKNYNTVKNFACVQNNSKYSVLPWVQTSEIYTYYNEAEIVVGKCGGAFLSEIITLRKKVIISGVFSVQEEGNLQYLQNNHADLLVEL